MLPDNVYIQSVHTYNPGLQTILEMRVSCVSICVGYKLKSPILLLFLGYTKINNKRECYITIITIFP